MATKKGNPKRRGVTPGKLVLIGMLAVILIVVIVAQMGDDTTVRANSNTRKTPAAPRNKLQGLTRTKPPANTPPATSPNKNLWQEIAIDQVIAHDPFALPKSLRPYKRPAIAQPANDADNNQHEDLDSQRLLVVHRQNSEEQLARQRLIEQKVAALQEQGIAMVFVGGGEPMARIGSRNVRVGDVIDGMRIVEIRTDGNVVVEYADDDSP